VTFLEANQSKHPRLSYRADWALAYWAVKETRDVQSSNPYAQGWSEERSMKGPRDNILAIQSMREGETAIENMKKTNIYIYISELSLVFVLPNFNIKETKLKL
jgi:hypothetical protein